MTNAGATKFERITYLDFIARGLKVMDTTSVSLSKDNKLPIIVFKLGTHGNIKRVVQGENVGTLVTA
jgi:uridylate kinase